MTPDSAVPGVLVIGNVNVDLILGPHGAWPVLGTEVLMDHLDVRVGGNAGNALMALQGLGLPAIGIAGVGHDLFGSWLRTQLQAVQMHWLDAAAVTSVTVALQHEHGERTMFTHAGHLGEMDAREVLAALAHCPEGGTALLAGAFLTPRLAQDYAQVLETLRHRGILAALDPGWPPEGWTAGTRQALLSWAALSRELILNEAEALGLSGTATLPGALDALRSWLPATCTLIVKCGPDGAWIDSGGERFQVAAPAVTVIDTVGAGDTFNAAYLAARAGGAGLEAAAQEGVLVASRAISTFPRQYRGSAALPR